MVAALLFNIRILTLGQKPGFFRSETWFQHEAQVASDVPYTVTLAATPLADVSIIKRVQPSRELEPGQMVTYTLTFRNEGLVVARAVTITDEIPAQLVEPNIITSGIPITVASGRQFEWYAGDLAPGQGGIITITARLDPAYPWHSSESLFNQASIATATAEADYDNNRDGALAIVITSDVYVTKNLTSSGAIVAPRGMIRYDIVVGNYGPALPRSVVITDTFPEHTTWFADTSTQEGFSRNLDGGWVSWATDVLTHSEKIIIWLKVDEDAPGGEVLVNRAEASTSTADSDLTNNQDQSIPVTVHAVNLRVTSDVADQAEPGQVLTYTITYRNVGTLPTPGAVLTDVLPPQVSFLHSDPAPSFGENGIYTWTLGELLTWATGAIELAGRIPADTAIGTVLTNTVAISATIAESYTGDNGARATTRVVAGKPHTVTVVTEPQVVSVVGPSASITARVKDVWGNSVEDDTLVRLATTLGTITPTATPTTKGVVTATLNPGTIAGVADVTASAGTVTGTAQVTIRPGPATMLTLETEPAAPTVEDVVTVTLTARDQYANPVEDGTPATFATTLGVITPTLTAMRAGMATAMLTSTVPGMALITATAQGLVTESVTVTIRPGPPFTVTLAADPPSIEVGGATAVITATVCDRFGNTVADGTVVTYTTDLGTIQGGQVYTTTTSSGRAWAVLTSGQPGGTATVQVNVGGLVREIAVPFTGYGYHVYLPLTLARRH